MSRVYIYKGKEAKIVDISQVVEHYEKGWTDDPAKKAMTEEEIARARSGATERSTPCPTCGHMDEPEAPEEVVEVEVDADEPVEEGEEPTEESGISYNEYKNAELIEMIEAEGEKPAAGAKKEDLIKTLKYLRGE